MITIFLIFTTFRYGLRPLKTDTIKDLKSLLSNIANVPIANLKISKVYSHKQFEISDDALILSIRSDDIVVA
jgi:hypothetical protein